MSPDTGGPAFPVQGQMYGDKLGGQLFHGMTLRDYFAGQALRVTCEDFGPREAAIMAYEYAEAMLAIRESQQ